MAFHRYERVKNPKGNLFTDYRKVTYYDYHEVDKLINDLFELGYENCQIYEGSLGSGDWICVPPDDDHYYYIIVEKALNEWQSGHLVKRCSKLSKKNEQALNHYYACGTEG